MPSLLSINPSNLIWQPRHISEPTKRGDYVRQYKFISKHDVTNIGKTSVLSSSESNLCVNPYPTAFPYGNGMVLHFYQQQESSTTKTVHKVINRGLKAYV